MKIDKFKLTNFRAASELEFQFHEQLNLFVGTNGSGKSTVLDALSISLSWLVRRIERDKGRGATIPELSIRNGEDSASLDIEVSKGEESFEWLLAKTAKGRKTKSESQLSGVSKLADELREKYEENRVWPVIAYYPINRIVGAISPEVSKVDTTYDLDVYENAFGGKANYQSFFEWFRTQDDILNEWNVSRSRWMRNNRGWVKKRIFHISDIVSSYNRKIMDFFDRNFMMKKIKFERESKLYYKPFQLFQELIILANSSSLSHSSGFKKLIKELEALFFKIEYLNSDIVNDFFEDLTKAKAAIEHFLLNLKEIVNESQVYTESMVRILWDLFSYGILVTFYWLDDMSKSQLEGRISLLGEQFYNGKVSKTDVVDSLFNLLHDLVEKDSQRQESVNDTEGQKLQAVTFAIEQFIPEYSNLRVKRTPSPHMLVDKKGQSFNLEQLSDGEKNLIVLVGDIARRLAIGNPKSDNPLEGEGIILIDEIDLHLHPSWQRLVIPRLLEVFPNCQFFITTHSPQAISHVKPDNLFLLENDEEGLSYRRAEETYGMPIERVVKEVMDDEDRPELIRIALDRLFELIARKKFSEAKEIIETLKKDMPGDHELMRARLLIRREEMKG